MKYVKQPKGSNLCGQACVAMLAEISLEESVKIFGKSGKTRTRDLHKALEELEIYSTNRLKRVKKGRKFCNFSILKVSWENGGSHWAVFKNNKIYDPSVGVYKLNKYRERIEGLGKITSYLLTSKP